MRSVKRFIFRLIRLLRVANVARWLTRRRLKILLYHGVAPSSGHVFNYRRKFVAPASFEKQVEFLARNYTILPLDEAVHLLYENKLPRHAVAITFDDGYRNNFEYAFPTLRTLGIPATIFLATDFVFDGKPLWVDRLEYVMEHSDGTPADKRQRDDELRTELKTLPDDEKIRRLSEIETKYDASLHGDAEQYAPLTNEMIVEMSANLITFGAHTKSHPILGRLPFDAAASEILESRDIVKSHTSSVSTVFAYPNGQQEDWTPEIESLLAKNGFSGALTTVSGTNTPQTPRFALQRYTMDNTDDWDSFIATESGFRGILQTLRISLWQTFFSARK